MTMAERKTHRLAGDKTSRPLRVALDAAMVHLRTFAVPDPITRPPVPADA
jgi:hypothetical protein